MEAVCQWTEATARVPTPLDLTCTKPTTEKVYALQAGYMKASNT